MLPLRNSSLKQLPWLTLLTGAAALLIFAAPPELASSLQFDRANLTSVWRLLTAHLTHWNLEHLTWDVLMLLIVGTLVERHSRKGWIVTMLFTSIIVSTSVLLFKIDLQLYRGLSGLDMALAGTYIVSQIHASKSKSHLGSKNLYSFALLILLAKPLIEVIRDQPLFISDLGQGIENVPLAHLIGAFTGILVAMATRPQQNVHKKCKPSRNRSSILPNINL